jgi:SAM-dependent methyltransferase
MLTETTTGGDVRPADLAAEAPADRASWWTRFVAANKRFCRAHLQPRLYPVSHMAALEQWYSARSPEVPGGAMLEFGCGHTFRLSRLLAGRYGRTFGSDLDPVDAADVPDGVVFRQCAIDSIPFDDEQFDVVLIRSVLEHVDDPERTFAELARVTKPGGRVLIYLPNKWDYVSVVARVSGPLKKWLLRTVVRPRWDDYPVRYRCNTRRAIRRLAAQSGFTVDHFMPLPSQPSYLAFFVPFYVVGAIYQFVISITGADALQPSYTVIMRRTAERSGV